jgi:hypothetical protein
MIGKAWSSRPSECGGERTKRCCEGSHLERPPVELLPSHLLSRSPFSLSKPTARRRPTHCPKPRRTPLSADVNSCPKILDRFLAWKVPLAFDIRRLLLSYVAFFPFLPSTVCHPPNVPSNQQRLAARPRRPTFPTHRRRLLTR